MILQTDRERVSDPVPDKINITYFYVVTERRVVVKMNGKRIKL